MALASIHHVDARKRFLLIAAIAAVLSLGIAYWNGYFRSRDFLAVLRQLDDTAFRTQAFKGEIGVPFGYRVFKDGSWIAVIADSEAAGSFRDLAVLRDSEGRYFESRDKFSGIEEMQNELNGYDVDSSQAFEQTQFMRRWHQIK